MKRAIISLLLCIAGSGSAHANTYNECVSTEQPGAGIYFEQGYEQTSPNSSEHFFQRVHVRVDGEHFDFKIDGDELYRAQCKPTDESTSETNLSESAYAKMNATYRCDAESYIKIHFDVNRNEQPNGFAEGRHPSGKAFALKLNCRR